MLPVERPDGMSAYLLDTTLRDGEQTPGVAFSPEQKRHIVESLDALGVGEMEVGTPAMGDDEVAAIRSIVAMRPACRLSVWCRARREDLDAAERCGVGAVHVSLPTSSIHLDALGKTRGWVLEQIHVVVREACRRFSCVSVGAQDASRATIRFLLECVGRSVDVGVRRFRLADTVGVWTPSQTHRAVRSLVRAAPDVEIGFHAHNDLGMATANSVAAVEAGAACVDVTVGGLGERAGNAPIEEVAVALAVARGLRTLDTQGLHAICSRVAEWVGRPIPANKPITGAGVFRHESGVHVDGLLRDPRTYEPFAAETVGRSGREITLGKHSGASAVRHVLSQSGVDVSRDEARAMLPALRAGESLAR